MTTGDATTILTNVSDLVKTDVPDDQMWYIDQIFCNYDGNGNGVDDPQLQIWLENDSYSGPDRLAFHNVNAEGTGPTDTSREQTFSINFGVYATSAQRLTLKPRFMGPGAFREIIIQARRIL
jgi:hypothetical protein